MTEPWVAVVVPAHDEASVLDRCLRSLLVGAPAGMQVVVVSNGSTDDTVLVARSMIKPLRAAGHTLQVEAMDAPGKPMAVRRGLEVSSARPVVVMDADIELAGVDLRRIADALPAALTPHAAVLRMDLATSRSSVLVRRWARVWSALPYARVHLIGSGVVAVDEAGAEVVSGLPDVLNDDAWIRRQFDHEQRVPVDVGFVAHAPRTARALVRRRARVVLGNDEVRDLRGQDPARTGRSDVRRLLAAGEVGRLDVFAFLLVTLAVRVTAKARRLRGTTRDWGTDRTSR